MRRDCFSSYTFLSTNRSLAYNRPSVNLCRRSVWLVACLAQLGSVHLCLWLPASLNSHHVAVWQTGRGHEALSAGSAAMETFNLLENSASAAYLALLGNVLGSELVLLNAFFRPLSQRNQQLSGSLSCCHPHFHCLKETLS